MYVHSTTYSKQVLHLTSTPPLSKIRSAGILSIWQKETTSSHIWIAIKFEYFDLTKIRFFEIPWFSAKFQIPWFFPPGSFFHHFPCFPECLATLFIALAKKSIQIMRSIFFFILRRKHRFGYLLLVLHRGTSNEYHSICFLWEIRKNVNFPQVNLGWTMKFDHLLVHGQVIKLNYSTTLHVLYTAWAISSESVERASLNFIKAKYTTLCWHAQSLCWQAQLAHILT